MSETTWKIGELAKRTGSTIETIRFYERAGLLPAPSRSTGNYRQYGPEHEDQLAFVRRCRSLDMSLNEIQTLLAVRNEPTRSCQEVNDMLDEHLEHLRSRIEELQSLQKQLRTVRSMCRRTQTAKDCAILSELAGKRSFPQKKSRQITVHRPGAKR